MVASLPQDPAAAAAFSGVGWYLWLLSADTPDKLRAAVVALEQHLKSHPELSAGQVARALALQQPNRSYRAFVVCSDVPSGLAGLRSPDRQRSFAARADGHPPATIFLLPGVGDHYPEMGRDLYASQPVFRQAIDRCADLAAAYLRLDLRAQLYATPDERNHAPVPQVPALDFRRMVRGAAHAGDQAERFHRAGLAQVLVFAVDYAMAQLWLALGLRPAAMLGYSLGEYVAACLAGVLSLDDALALVCQRGQLIESLPAGAMLAVACSPRELDTLLPDGVGLAAINGPDQCIVGGSAGQIEHLERLLAQGGITCRRVQSSHAMHGQAMESVRPALTAFAAGMPRRPPCIPYLSNVTGDWMTAADATDPAYWGRHLCQPVRLADALEKLAAHRPAVFLEVGPGGALSSLALQHPAFDHVACTAITSMRSVYESDCDLARFLTAAGKLWLAGGALDWSVLAATWPMSTTELPASVIHPQAACPQLPAQERAHSADLPCTDGEKLVAAIWQEVLKVRTITLSDNFFALGGNSLQGARVIARVYEQFGVTTSLKTLFAAPTLAQFADFVMRQKPDTVEPPNNQAASNA